MGHLLTLFNRKSVIVYDSFNRANNAGSLGIADTGQPWEKQVGVWGTINNTAYCSTSEATINITTISTGLSDFKLSAVFADSSSGSPALVFRFIDMNNFFILQRTSNGYTLAKRVSGAFTTLGSYTTTPLNGDRISVNASKENIVVNINSVIRITATDSFNMGGTKHGLYATNTTPRFDDFKAEAI